MDELGEALAEQIRFVAADQVGDRRAGVAAATAAEHEDEIRRRGDQAAEVGGLAAGGRDQRPPEQQRDEEAGDTQRDLERHEVGDVLVGARRDGAGRVERDVLGERGDDAEPGDRVGGLDVAGPRSACTESSGRPSRTALPGRDEIGDEPLLLHRAGARAERVGHRGERGLVVVAVDRGRLAAVEQDARALLQQSRGVRRDRPAKPARFSSTSIDVTLRERALPGRDLDDRGAVLRSSRSPGSRARCWPRRAARRARGSRRRCAGRASASGRKVGARRITASPRRRCPCRRGSGPTCCRTSRSARDADAPAGGERSPDRPASSAPTVRCSIASSSTVRPSSRSGSSPSPARTTKKLVVVGPAVLQPDDHVSRRQPLGHGDVEVALAHLDGLRAVGALARPRPRGSRPRRRPPRHQPGGPAGGVPKREGSPRMDRNPGKNLERGRSGRKRPGPRSGMRCASWDSRSGPGCIRGRCNNETTGRSRGWPSTSARGWPRSRARARSS